MKRKYVLAGVLALLHFGARSQSAPYEHTVDKTTVELVYNHYFQDGDHSAVTGGKGTEQLTVYGPMAEVTDASGKNTFSFALGADIISSASTDNIDFVKSSASAVDARAYTKGVYERKFTQGLSVYGGVGVSVESDYSSLGSKLGMVLDDRERLATFTLEAGMFNDDLRWGRFNEKYRRPVQLIYPVELRYKEWYEPYKRNSHYLKAGYSRAVDPRNVLGVFAEVTRQEGLLATPFHRIYFTDGTQGVEQLPTKRSKAALALRWNRFAGGSVILSNSVQGYVDDFGILSLSMKNQTAVKLKSRIVLLPNLRLHVQRGSRYFGKYMTHDPDNVFYTSDYDLSDFYDVELGFGMKFTPLKPVFMHDVPGPFVLRYSYFVRSDGLRAHIVSLAFQTDFLGKSEDSGN